MSSNEDLTKDTIEMLQELEEDHNIPKNVKVKIKNLIEMLNGDSETAMKMNKVSSELDEISNDSNLDQFTRTQIWSIVSSLEKVNH